MAIPHPQKQSLDSQPDKDAVASPSDPVAVEQDVARKLRIYGMVQALRRGRLPGNTQLDHALVVLRDMLTRRTELPQKSEAGRNDASTPMSDEGRTVVRDIRDIVETARQLLRQKNSDEIVQDFIYHTYNVHISASALGVELPVPIDEVREDGETAVHHLRTLIRIFLTNREARKLLSDSKLILRDLFAQTAVAVAERARPSALEMEGLDDAAPSQDWAGFGEYDEGEVGNGHPPAGTRISSAGQDDRESPPVPTEEERRRDAIEPQQAHPKESVTNKDSSKSFGLNLKDRFRTLLSRVPSTRRARAEKALDDAKAYLADEVPQERRDQFVWRLKKVVTECQSTPSYQASISWFLTLLGTYLSSAGALATSHATQTNYLFAGDPILARAVADLRTISERGAGGRSLSGVLSALGVLWGDARGDKEMREWWDAVDLFVNKTLLQPGYITSSQFASQSRKLRASGRHFFTQKYKTHADELVDAAQAWSRAWTEDPLHVRFADEWTKLVRDLLFDEKGGLMFKTPLWEDMRAIILPGILRKIGVIPIPRIEYADHDLDLVIENLTLQGTNLFPKTIELRAKHYSKFSPFGSKDASVHRTDIMLKLSGIQADMKDVVFDYRRKTGLALGIGKMRDGGLADIFVGGRGITVIVKLANPTPGATYREGAKGVYEVKNVHVKVEGLKFTIRESNHDFLYKALRPVVTRLIRHQIIKVFGDGIRTSLVYIDEQLAAARAGMAKAKLSEDGSKRKFVKQFWHTQSTHISKRKRDSAFRLVPKRESTLWPNQGKKGRIRRQAEKDAQAAEEGIGWRSEAFNISPHTHTTS